MRCKYCFELNVKCLFRNWLISNTFKLNQLLFFKNRNLFFEQNLCTILLNVFYVNSINKRELNSNKKNLKPTRKEHMMAHQYNK